MSSTSSSLWWISEEDKERYKEYIEYFKCGKCKEYIIDDFKYCTICNIFLCNKCKCDVDSHEIKHPRHIVSLLEKIKFHCKFCNDIFIYKELKRHTETCNLNNKIRCRVCHNEVSEREYEQHMMNCNEGNNEIDINSFMSYIDTMKNNVRDYIDNQIEIDEEEMKKEIESALYNKLSESESISNTKLYSTMNEVEKKEAELKSQREILYNKINTTVNNLHSSISNTNIQSFLPNSKLQNENELLLSYIKQVMQSLPNPLCSICLSSLHSNTQFYCSVCACFFCKDKCAQKCHSPSCANYLCPKDTKNCSLCFYKNYCSSCMIKCFYEKCDNYFCPECYNRNKHQQRDKGESCNLVPCEICQNDMCIMTSILCSHCDKRICNNCFINEDIEIHRSNIKIKKNNLNY